MASGISVRNLRKEFFREGQHKVAVDGLNLEIYDGQITALLGHNGAGKTTTMSMLTGFIPPTSGTARVNGYDIRHEIDKVRGSLGLCPQHDVLFDILTVSEHLRFFAKLKGSSGKEVDQQVDEMIKLLGLSDKRDVFTKELSGGMKRKLSVGIALIADSKIVILDEPTSGMDPDARRQTWDILQSQRKGRTMLLTTHFMDEADLLGDRIAIMADGIVQCCGSSLFLKGKYGVGYHMVIVKDVPKCDVSRVTSVITKYVPGAAMESNVGAELSYVLPHESSAKFEELFTYLENEKSELGINSFGASVTTMEEVFIRVGENVDETLKGKLQGDDGVANSGFETESTPIIATDIDRKEYTVSNGDPDSAREVHVNLGVLTSEPAPPERNTGIGLYAQQFWAMFFKRVLHSWRNRLVTVSQLLVPFILALIACIIIVTFPAPRDAPPLSLSLQVFKDPVIAYSTGHQTVASKQMVDAYTTAAKSQASQVDKVPDTTNMTDYMVKIAVESMETYNGRYLVAGSFEGNYSARLNTTNSSTLAVAHFNNQGYHTPALSLSIIANALLGYFVNSSYSLETINHPLPRSQQEKVNEDLTSSAITSFVLSYNIMFGMAFLVSTFAVFLIKERSVKAKHCQFVSGVHSVNFWFSTLAWDFLNFLVPCALLLALFAAFNIKGYVEGNNLGYVTLIFLLFAWSSLATTYLLSFLFTVPASGYVWLVVLNIFTGSAAVLAVIILRFPGLGTEDVADVLEWVFYVLLPNFCFGQSMQDLFLNYQRIQTCFAFGKDTLEMFCFLLPVNITNPCCKDKCGDNCATLNEDYLGWEYPGIGRALVFMAVQGVVFLALVFLIESNLLLSLWQRAVAGRTEQEAPDSSGSRHMLMRQLSLSRVQGDDDVLAETARINKSTLAELQKTDSLILRDLRKFYGNFCAVDRLSLGVPQGECFGLLGINGAGKTTTFKMMTGDETISSGNAFLDGYDVKTHIKQVQQRLGYCPQFDALIDQMTVRETLVMYSHLRGVKRDAIPEVVTKMIKALMLEQYTDKLAGDLSGGNKRKLSTAIALIGDPPIVFLDEPTTGMDPVARRLLWDTLSRVRDSGRTLILTSHSMEECEALCTRIAIMVNGQFKCLGSPQHLKHKFGEGYTLMAKITIKDKDPDEAMQPFLDFVEQTFPNSILKDLHQGIVVYQINDRSLGWAQLFGTMERAKEKYFLEDYSVSQTTLEQVFINFARAQRPPREEGVSTSTKCGNVCRFFCCCGCCSKEY